MKKLIAICALSIAGSACAANGTENAAMSEMSGMKKHHAPHIISTQSNAGFAATLSQARAAIDARGFKTFAVIDHAAGAASINEALRPTTLIIFGNPKGGTPLMQAEQKLGLQLPLKLLISEEDDGSVSVTYPDMEHLFHEYGIAGLTGSLGKIEGALGAIATEAGAN